MNAEQLHAIEGAKGKGASGGGAKEAPNTLSSRAVVKVVEVLSEGEIVGLVGGAKGIYINDTPLQNSDGSYNFARTAWDYRVGLPDQDYMQGFSGVEAEFVIGSTITTSTPATRSTSATDIDAVRVTISLPQGLYSQNTTNGNMNGTKVEFAIDTKLTSSGSWVQYSTYAIDGKTTSATEKQYRVNRPAGVGTWDIRVRRLTADSAVTSLRNQIALARVTEVQDIKLPYNDTAYVGLAIDAESVGNQVPRRTYLVKGLKVKVPSNYNPTTRVYTGIWNGTFTNAWTDNPAWVLYDLLTHPRYGMGEFVSESQVDKFSFYDAAVYNDELVDDGNGGTEPRFTFNAPLATREEAFRLLTLVAGAMRAQLIYAEGVVKLLQDRPADPVKLVTKANVINGKFDYRSTGLLERHTAFNVAFRDREDRHLERITTIDSSTVTSAFQTMLEAAEARYGYNPIDIVAFGATTESQAIRQGMWALDTELNQTELVQFKMSLNGFDLFPGDIIKVWDEDYAATAGGGRIVSVSGTTVVLDRPVALAPASKIDVVLADGTTIEQRLINEVSGSFSTITIATAFSQAVLPGADYIITAAVAPRQFRIMGLRQEEANIVAVEALYHDPNKYARVEDNVNLPTPVFTTTKPTVCNAPTALTFREIQVNNEAEGLNGLRRSLLVSWVAPTLGIVKRYTMRYRLDNGEWTTVEPSGPSFEISPAFGGTYEVSVAAISSSGNTGPSTSGTYAITTSGGGASTLNAPTTLQVIGGGTDFSGNDINFQWTNPASNATVLDATLRDFEVRIIETTGSTEVRRVYFPAVAPGSIQTASYTFSMNLADGGPRRTLQVQVRCRDAKNNLSDPVTATFTNPAPAALTGIGVVSGIGSVKISFNLPTETDFKGVLVWRSTTTGFTPSSANLIADGMFNYFSDTVDFGTTYYYKIAAYDTFSKPLDGAGLNISAQQSGEAAAGEGVPEVSVLPDPSGYTGPKIVFLTTDGQLYSYVSGDWQTTIPAVSDVEDGSITVAKFASGLRPIEIVSGLPGTPHIEGRLVYLTSNAKVYRNDGTGWVSSVASGDITGQLTNSQIADLAAAKVTGQVVSAQIADAAITNTKIAANAVTANSIAADSINASKIVAGSITGDRLLADTITSNQIATGAITATELASNSVIAGKIAAGAVTATEIAAGAITTAKLGAGAVTANELAAGAVTTVKLAAGAVTANELAANSVTAGKIAASTITGDKIAGSTITGDRMVANTITGDKVAASTIDATRLSVASLSAITANLGTVTAGWVSGLKFTTGAFTDWAWPAAGQNGSYLGPSGLLIGNYYNGRYFQVTAAGDIYAPGFSVEAGNARFGGTLEANTVTTGSIQAGAVTESRIGDLNVTTLKIANNAVTIPVSAFTTSPTTGGNTATGNNTSAYVGLTVASISFTSSGNAIKVDGHAEVCLTTGGGYSNNSSFDGLIQIQRNGSALLSVPAIATGQVTSGTTTAYIFPAIPWVVDQPGAGTWTYSVVFYYRKSGGAHTAWCNGTARSRGIFAIEAKK